MRGRVLTVSCVFTTWYNPMRWVPTIVYVLRIRKQRLIEMTATGVTDARVPDSERVGLASLAH